MTDSPPLSREQLDALLAGVERPARYIGGELGSVAKPEASARIALCFPDLYEIGESFLGFKILYDAVNRRAALAAERAYAVAPDLERRMRNAGVPLWSLESRRPLHAFDVLGFTLQYELSYPTVLTMLELGGVSLRTAARREDEPFVIGGGSGTTNPEPVAPFFDAFLLGDGEEALVEMLELVGDARRRGLSRSATLAALAAVEGVYVPSHIDVRYDGLRASSITATPEAPPRPTSRHGTPRVSRRVLPDLDAVPYPIRQIQPNVQPVHDRFAIEIQRGCSRGCRFCQAGMIQRPTRQRRPETVLAIAEAALATSGVDTLGLLSLSAGDYGALDRVLDRLLARCGPDRIALSLPSLRTETLTPAVAARVNAVTSGGFTLAPEAGSERLRRVINKTNREEDLLAAVRAAVGAGARAVKLYFMLGLPTETDADLDAIVELALRARAAGRAVRRDMQVTVSVSTFVPKPHTPFQWERQVTVEETLAKQRRLRERLRSRRIAVRYHDPGQSFVEGVLARGDRRLADGIEAAMRAGCRLDAWNEHFDPERWTAALTTALAPYGLTPGDYLHERAEEGLLAWDHLDAGVLKKFLRRERKRAYAEAAVVDCALEDRCYACGGCDLGDPYLDRATPPSSRRPLVPLVQPRELPSAAAEAGPPSAEPAPAADRRADATPGPRTRLRFRYQKVGRAVHLSQLEAVDQLLRAIRHARLPVVYSQGFTKRPRVSFSPACPTGIESRAEYVDVLSPGVAEATPWIASLNRHLPEGLAVLEGEALPASAPSVTEQIASVTYAVELPREERGAAEREMRAFLERERVPVRVGRKGSPRVYDARRAVLALRFADGRLAVTLGFGMQGALKITEALAAILGPELAARCGVCKEDLAFGPGEAAPLAGAPADHVLDLMQRGPRGAAEPPGLAVQAGGRPYAE